MAYGYILNLLILFLIIIILFFVHQQYIKTNDQKIEENVHIKKYKKKEQKINILKKSKKKIKKIKHVNTNFVEMQYNKDYNDTITAINKITTQKELFNLGLLPVKEVIPNEDNIKSLVKIFMKKLKEENEKVQEYLHTNSGWNDMGKRRKEKSGFEEQMEELGLPGTLYNEPAAKASAKLIRIDKYEQFNTDNQIRFIVYIIIQKPNVKEQMVLKIQFFMEKEDTDNNILDTPVIIEQVFILGYLTDEIKKDNFHDYGNIYNDGMIDQAKVLKIMQNKHLEREKELNNFTNNNKNILMNNLSKFPK